MRRACIGAMLLPILFVCIQHLPPSLAGKRSRVGVTYDRIPHCILLWSYHDHVGRTAAENHPYE